MLKLNCVAASLVVACCVSGGAHAATYTFNMTYDGTSIALDAGSDDPNGLSLNGGDDFYLTLKAAGNDFWKVTSSLADAFVPLDFGIVDSGIRTVDIMTGWLLDGTLGVESDQTGVVQEFVHLGAQTWSLAEGTMFDEVRMHLSLASALDPLTGDPTTTVIDASGPTIFTSFGNTLFFADGPANGKITYVSAAVPVPAGGVLYLPVLAGAGLLALRRKRNPDLR